MYIKQLFGTERPTLKDIERFVKSYKEDSRLEFKESVSEDTDKLLLRPVVAFANSEGGVLLIGITDRERKIVGVEIENEKLDEDLEHLILSRIEPSLAGLFVIESVITHEGKSVFIIEVERSPEIHALRIKKNKSDKNKIGIEETYAYFYRSAMSVRTMTPSVLNRISATKRDLRYNFEYRINIFIKINEFVSQLLFRINPGRKAKVDEGNVKNFAQEFLVSVCSYENAPKLEIVNLLRTIRLEFLYDEIWIETVEFYAILLRIERDSPHTLLTFEEEKCFRNLKSILNEGLGIRKERPDIESVLELKDIGLDPKIFSYTNLKLLSVKSVIVSLLTSAVDQVNHDQNFKQKLLNSFDEFIRKRKNFYWKVGVKDDELLTINNVVILIEEFLKEQPGKDYVLQLDIAYSWLFRYLCQSSMTFSKMILKLLELRDFVYENLSLPIDKDTSLAGYKKYIKEHGQIFAHPAYIELY